MPRPLLVFSQSDHLIQIVDINSHTEWQTVWFQISWLLQKPTDLDLHCLQRQGISGFSRTRVKKIVCYNSEWYFNGQSVVCCHLCLACKAFTEPQQANRYLISIVKCRSRSACMPMWCAIQDFLSFCVEVLRPSCPTGVCWAWSVT